MSLPDPAERKWCDNHMNHIGLAEVRYRTSKYCRFCYEAKLTYGSLPDKEFLRSRRNRGYTSDRDATEFARRLKDSKTKRKKAS
jgi:hypothetical protein